MIATRDSHVMSLASGAEGAQVVQQQHCRRAAWRGKVRASGATATRPGQPTCLPSQPPLPLRLTQLVHLFLQDNRITSLGQCHVGRKTQNHFKAPPLPLGPALRSLGKLQLLRLDGNCLTRVAPWEVEGCRELRLLDLSNNGLVEFSCGRGLPELTSLNLSDNRLTQSPADLQHCLKVE